MNWAFRVTAILCLTAFSPPSPSIAHSPYGKALKNHYELRAVTCYTCHVKGKDKETGKRLGKEHLNKFGEALHELLEDKQVTERVEATKKSEADERKKVNQWAAEEFLKAFAELENETADAEKTWQELIRSGEQDGIKLKKKK